jgi:16S rRNA (guanine527-N7)-methyltransferase
MSLAGPTSADPMSKDAQAVGRRLNELLNQAGLQPLSDEQGWRFQKYCALLLRWNARTNLTAIRDQEGILSRHFVESIACAQNLPGGISTLLDFGSGAGFPGLPIAVCRPEIAVTLAESQGKKAAFLREVVRVLDLSVTVHSGRAEALPDQFDCVTLRAVDRMPEAVRSGILLLRPGGWLALMTTESELPQLQEALGGSVSWQDAVSLPGAGQRVLGLAKRNVGKPS